MVAKVRFWKSELPRLYDYDCFGIKVAAGDWVLVPTQSNEPKVARVIKVVDHSDKATKPIMFKLDMNGWIGRRRRWKAEHENV